MQGTWTLPGMWSDSERWGIHSSTHYSDKPTLTEAVRARRATDTIPCHVGLDEGHTEASSILSAWVGLGHSADTLLWRLPPFPYIALTVTYACAPTAVPGQMYGHGFSENSISFPTEQRER